MREPIDLEFTVSCSPEHAFEVWHSRRRSGGRAITPGRVTVLSR
jgi:hypothetical protein